MSNEIFAFIPSGRIPTRDEWQHALDTLDMGAVKLSIFPALDVEHAKGFCPMLLCGVAAGVEVDFGIRPIDDFETMVTDIPALAGKVTPEHTAIAFRMGSRLSEAVSAEAACAGLVSGFGATVYDDLANEVYMSPSGLIAAARMNLMWVEYGSDKPPAPEFLDQLEQVNGGPLPRLTVTLQPMEPLVFPGHEPLPPR